MSWEETSLTRAYWNMVEPEPIVEKREIPDKIDSNSDIPRSIQFDNMRYGDFIRDIMVRFDLPNDDKIINALSEMAFRATGKFIP